jgi:hypothetical protein
MNGARKPNCFADPATLHKALDFRALPALANKKKAGILVSSMKFDEGINHDGQAVEPPKRSGPPDDERVTEAQLTAYFSARHSVVETVSIHCHRTDDHPLVGYVKALAYHAAHFF